MSLPGLECAICHLPISDPDGAHASHELGCENWLHAEDWSCGCDALAHPACCLFCEVERLSIQQAMQ